MWENIKNVSSYRTDVHTSFSYFFVSSYIGCSIEHMFILYFTDVIIFVMQQFNLCFSNFYYMYVHVLFRNHYSRRITSNVLESL